MGKLRGLYILKVNDVLYSCEYDGDEIDNESVEVVVADDGSQHNAVTPKASTLSVNILETDDLTLAQLEAVYKLRDGQVDFDFGNGHGLIIRHAFAAPGQKSREGKRPVTFTGSGSRV